MSICANCLTGQMCLPSFKGETKDADNNPVGEGMNYNSNMNSNNNDGIETRNRHFFLYNLLAAPRTISNTYAQVARAHSCANHVLYESLICTLTSGIMKRAKGRTGSSYKCTETLVLEFLTV